MNLVIVESPTKARTLKRFLGDDYTIEASMGHVRDLPKSKLGVNLDDNFEPEYETAKGKGKVITKLKTKAKEAKTIYLAMDPDREGEAIAWHVAHLLTGKKTKKSGAGPNFQRVTFHEITQSAIKEAIDHPHQLNLSLVDAQQARRVLDRLVGYNLSPVLWKKVRRGLSAGRVQSVALRLIVEREREIEAFKPQEYWEVLVKLGTGKSTSSADSTAFDQLGEGQFIAGLYEINGSKLEIKGKVKDKQGLIYLTGEKEVKPVTADLKTAAYTIESVDKTERKRSPYPPYITSTLQQAAANTLGWSGKQTMRIAQELYEKGLITYHRTDSTSLSTQAIEAARNLVNSRYGAEYLPEKPRLYKTKSKSAQEAHEAIRPTDAAKDTLTDGESGLTARHQKLYRLIWQRLISSQMKDAIYDQTSITVLAKGKGEYRLRTSGSIMKFQGWRVIYNGKGEASETILPPVEPEQNLSYVDLKSDQKFTQPPPRYNDASLVKELEKRGIGRPSTYASIISVIEDRGYVERDERRFKPTIVGTTVTEFLTDHFDVVMDYDFTAEMEENLDRIARGEKEWHQVIGTFYKPFAKTVTTVEDKVERVKIPVETTGKPCPTCKEGELVVRTGRFGRFLSCGRFPECKHTAPLVEKLENFPCPECKSDVVIKRTRRGRMFYGCSSYPKCDWASWKDPRPQEGNSPEASSK